MIHLSEVSAPLSVNSSIMNLQSSCGGGQIPTRRAGRKKAGEPYREGLMIGLVYARL